MHRGFGFGADALAREVPTSVACAEGPLRVPPPKVEDIDDHVKNGDGAVVRVRATGGRPLLRYDRRELHRLAVRERRRVGFTDEEVATVKRLVIPAAYVARERFQA